MDLTISRSLLSPAGGRERRWLCVVPSRIWASLLREKEEGEVTKLVIACHGQDRFGEREGKGEGRDMRDVFLFCGERSPVWKSAGPLIFLGVQLLLEPCTYG